MRDKTGLFVAEGLKIVSDIVAKSFEIDHLIASNDFLKSKKGDRVVAALEQKKVPVCSASAIDFEKISSLRAPEGVLAAVKKNASPEPIEKAEEKPLLVLCDTIQDPGNLGTIIRTSVAFGASGILLAGETADIYNPKVVRASAGAILDIPVYDCPVLELDRLKETGYVLMAGQAVGGSRAKGLEGMKGLKTPIIIAFGSEGQGISEVVAKKADGFFFIPMTGEVESLNVTAAAAITIYELTRGADFFDL